MTTDTIAATARNTAARDDLVFDFGLHEGEDTDACPRKGSRTVAFEADPALVARRGARAAGGPVIVEGVDAMVMEVLERQPVRPLHAPIESTTEGPGALRAEFALLERLGCRSFKLAQQETILGLRLRGYGGVLRRCRLLGRGAPLRRLLRPRGLRVPSRPLGRPLPGWYDTHARLGEG